MDASKAKSGEVIMGKAQVLQRWTEYIKELYEDDRHKGKPRIRKDMHGPRILKADEIAVEQVKGLGEFRIEKLALVLNENIRQWRNSRRSQQINIHHTSKEIWCNRM